MSASIFGNGSGATIDQVSRLLHPGYPAGNFAWMTTGHAAATVAAADVLFIYPYPLFARVVITSISANTVGGGAGSSMKCAVWRNDPATARPTGLPIFGQNAGFNTSDTGFDTAAIANVPAGPEVLWFGSVFTGTMPQMVIQAQSGPGSSMIVHSSLAALGTPSQNMQVAQPYASDIMALNLTGASLVRTASPAPILALGWA